MEGKRCKEMKGMGMHMRMRHIPGYPIIPFVFPMAAALLSATCALWQMARMARALQVIAMANALNELKDRLTDDEKQELEERMRANLFPPCCH